MESEVYGDADTIFELWKWMPSSGQIPYAFTKVTSNDNGGTLDGSEITKLFINFMIMACII